MSDRIDRITEFYKDYYYPAVLLDNNLVVTYKNEAALAAKIKPRVGVNIKKYLDDNNYNILKNISESDQQIIELDADLKKRPNKCVALLSEDMIALVFFDSLNYIIKANDEQAAAQINEIASRYREQELIHAGDGKKMRKIRGYFMRHIANIESGPDDPEKNYCDIRVFMDNFKAGLPDNINNINFEIEDRDKLFLHRLNESDFLSLNFILLSYALSRSLFGAVNLKFGTNTGGAFLIYEFFPGTDFINNNAGKLDKSGGIDLEFAALIAENNNLRLEYRISEERIEKSVQIWVLFTNPGGMLAQNTGANNIISSEDIAERAEIELEFPPLILE